MLARTETTTERRMRVTVRSNPKAAVPGKTMAERAKKKAARAEAPAEAAAVPPLRVPNWASDCFSC